MRWPLLVCLIACKGDASKQAAPAKRATPDAAVAFDPKTIASRFTALRDDKALGCLLARSKWPLGLLQNVGEIAPPIVTRAAAFAQIERVRRDGDTPALDSLAEIVPLLGSVDDVDGLREAFAMIDKFGEPRSDINVYRARIGLENTTAMGIDDRLSTIREMALAGDAKASAAYEQLPKQDLATASAATHVKTLAALRRIDSVRVLIGNAKPLERVDLASAWLETEAHLGTPIKDAVTALVDALSAIPEDRRYTPRLLIDAVRRARRGPELAPFRAHAAKTSSIGLHEWFYIDALVRGDTAAQGELSVVPAERRARLEALHTGPLDKALALEATTMSELAVIWARWATTGDAAFAAKLAAAVCLPEKPRGTPTPAVAAKLAVRTKKLPAKMECKRENVIVQLVATKEVLDETELEAECHGACTPAEKREGQRELDRIRRAIDKGEATESETDHNFTDCYGTAYRVVRVDHVGDRDVALVAETYPGPHDVVYERHHVAVEVCGKVFVGEAFGELQLGRFEDAELKMQTAADGLEVVTASERFRGVVYRLHYPACPAAPDQQVIPVQ